MPDEDLYLDDDDRYSRLRLIAWWEQEKLAAAKVLVVGAGALGNEVLKNLALLGVGKVYIVDFDQIENSNLTRSVLFRTNDCGESKARAAARAVTDLNPDTVPVAIHGNVITDLGLGLFREVDVVIGCLDNREARLWVNRQCWKVGTPWVDGGIQEINGVVKVFVPPDSACYECGMTENDYRLINLRYSCPLLRQEDLQSGKVPTAPTISSMIAGLQTQEALKLIHGMPVESGTAMIYNGIANQFYKSAFQKKPNCLSHETYPDPIPLAVCAEKHPVSRLFQAVQSELGNGASLRLHLDRDLVVGISCEACKLRHQLMKPQQLVPADQARCPECGVLCQPELAHVIYQDSALADEQLSAVGIPKNDIVRVGAGEEEHIFWLAGSTGDAR